MTTQQMRPGESPGGVPHPEGDLYEPVPETGAPVGQDPVAVHADPGLESERQDDVEERGFPLGQVLVGGVSVVGLLGAALWQALGVVGLVAAGGAAAGGVAMYVRRRLGLGRSGERVERRTVRRAWSSTSGGGRALGGLLGGRGRGGGGRAGGRGAGRRSGGVLGGRSAGGGRGAVLGMPGLGKRGRRGGAAKAAGGGSVGGGGGVRNAARRVGRAVLASPAGARAAKAAKAVEAAGRAVRSRMDAATGGRAGRVLRAVGGRGRRAAAAAGRRIDRATGGRAGRWWRRHRGTVGTAAGSLGLGALVSTVLFGPWWLAGLLLSGLGGLVAWRYRNRKRRKADGSSQEDEAESTENAEKAENAKGTEEAGEEQARCQDCGREVPGGEVRQVLVDGQDVLLCPACYQRRNDGPVRDRRPRSTENRKYNSRRYGMEAAGFPIAVAASEVNTAAAAYEPEDMWAIGKDLRQLPDVFANVGLAIRTYAQRLEGDYPIHPQVVEAIGQLYVGLGALAAAAQDIEPLFRTLHADDLRREEAPRIAEHKWNV